MLSLLGTAACGDDDGIAGTGTGGDELPSDDDPGPSGPSCGPRIKRPADGSPEDLTGRAQLATITGVVAFTGDSERADEPAADRTASPAALPLMGAGRPTGATTKGPHIHERWGESRKLELSYCITRLLGDDAEIEAKYHRLIRSLVDTMAEWERVTGANFIHIAADDTPEADPHLSPGPAGRSIARPHCAAGTDAYFGVFTHPINDVQAVTNPVPQAWANPALEPPGRGVLARSMLINSALFSSPDDSFLRAVLRHELGHLMGFFHEEVNHPGSVGNQCADADPRPLTPVDFASVLTTPGCPGFSDNAEILTDHDRLSGFFLHHTPRSRFETRPGAIGYRYGGIFGGGAEILWHSEGATEGTLWRPHVVGGDISFMAQPFPYSLPGTTPAGGWYPNQSEVVIPLKLGAPNAFGLLFHGPGPDVGDLVVFNSGGTASAVEWPNDAFTVPVVGRFDPSDLAHDVVYLYQPGTENNTALVADDDEVSIVNDVVQQTGYAYPLAGPYRGTGYPDDIVWLDPDRDRVTTWRTVSGVLEAVEIRHKLQGELGLYPGEHIPAIGDFNGDGRADIMWQGVSNQAAGYAELEDVLWLSRSRSDELVFATIEKSVGRTVRPFVGDFDGDGIHDIFWHRSWGMTSEGASAFTTYPSYIWYFDEMGGHEAESFMVDGDWSPYVGDFDADGCHDIAWFDAVGDALHLWRCMPGVRDFDCGGTTPTPPDAAPVGMHWGF